MHKSCILLLISPCCSCLHFPPRVSFDVIMRAWNKFPEAKRSRFIVSFCTILARFHLSAVFCTLQHTQQKSSSSQFPFQSKCKYSSGSCSKTLKRILALSRERKRKVGHEKERREEKNSIAIVMTCINMCAHIYHDNNQKSCRELLSSLLLSL